MAITFTTAHIKDPLTVQNLTVLTPREWELLIFLSNDAITSEIADTLCITTKSVENYCTRIREKLNLKGRHRLSRFARNHQQELLKWFNLLSKKR